MDEADDEPAVERAARVGRWAFDGPDFGATLYRQLIDKLLIENRLIKNELTLAGRPVDLSNVTMPVAFILGQDDAYVPRSSSLPFLDAIPSDETTVFEFPTGHVGTFVDRPAHEEWWPRVCDWLTPEK